MRILNKLISLSFLLMGTVVMMTFASSAQSAGFTAEIQEMKQASRGPFSRLRWFCADGSVLPPEPYACSDHGGGVQHGAYSDTTNKIRSAGYPIATLLADLEPADILGSADGEQLLDMMLLEQFLVGFDDGWVYRKARFYRGAIQHEDEQRSGQALLEALAAESSWINDQFLVLREAVRLLPHDHAHLSLADLRGRAAAIADRDPAFRGLRGKIHGRPDVGDADRVREYAHASGQPALTAEYEALAQLIEKTYAGGDLPDVIEAALTTTSAPEIHGSLSQIANTTTAQPETRLAAAAAGMKAIRNYLHTEPNPAARVRLLDSSLEFERIAFVASREMNVNGVSRRSLLNWLQYNADALFGTGMITGPEHRDLHISLEHINDEPLQLERYRRELRQLGMASVWAARQLEFHFGAAIQHFSEIEPLVQQFVPDRLRGSQLLAFDSVHSTLSLDAQSAGAIRHELFGAPQASGLRSLNPGLARGVLYIADENTPISEFDAHGIYIVPETLPRLPPVAGLLTRSEGNALSHVQLLARNLGIPNIVVSDEILEQLQRYVGKQIVIASSAGGIVRIDQDSFEWDNVFRASEDTERAPLRINIDKLDLSSRKLYTLQQLRASDSGRVVGPKAAKLGELMHQFPGQVPPGVVVPFGVYRQLLEQPLTADRPMSMLSWLEGRYQYLEKLKDRDLAVYETELDETLDFVRAWFMQVKLPPRLEQKLRSTMKTQFGAEGTYGVFVRSDTNVEDLPNFSGAGLNLTVPNVVGFEETMHAIRRVWASPFTKRAFSWRQSLMDHPEHVYASVLVQVGVPAEKSGVLVTKDIDSGDRDVVTLVVNEGVGGGVDGQLAETLKVGISTNTIRRVATATATERVVLLKGGGVAKHPVSGSAEVLKDTEIEALRVLTRAIPQRIDEFAPRQGQRTPAADVEFGFYKGRLWLFQVRPFVESHSANRNSYLNALDAGLRKSADKQIDLDRTPLVIRS